MISKKQDEKQCKSLKVAKQKIKQRYAKGKTDKKK